MLNTPVRADATGLPEPPLMHAIAAGVCRALQDRAAALRAEAQGLTATVADQHGRPVQIIPPEARVKSRTADLLEECAAAVSRPGSL